MLTALLIGGILAVVIAGLVFSLSCGMWLMIINSHRRVVYAGLAFSFLAGHSFCMY